MGFQDTYNETKQLIDSFVEELYRALVKKRFEKMLDAFLKSLSIAQSVGTGIDLNTTQFKVFDKPEVLIAPTGHIAPVSSQMPSIRLNWVGSTTTKMVDGQEVTVIPVSEMQYDASIVEGMYGDAGEVLNKYPVVVAAPVDKESSYPGYDFKDYAYIYFLPTSAYYLGLSDWVDVNNPIQFKSLAELVHIGSALGWEGVPNMKVLRFRGHILSTHFANITQGTEYVYSFYMDCEVEVEISDEAGQNTDKITVNAPFVMYSGAPIGDSDFLIRVADMTQFRASITQYKLYAYMPNYTLTKGIIEIGELPE